MTALARPTCGTFTTERTKMTTNGLLRLVLLVSLACACEGPAGPAGASGDDASCSVVDNEDGTKTITCDDGTSVTIGDGTDGQSCTVVDNGDGTKTITCEDGTSVTITDGTDGVDCSVVDNGDGTKTITCEDGTSITIRDGEDGENGENGGNVEVANFHGTDSWFPALLEEEQKSFVNATIDSASADPSGVVTVNFTVTDALENPVADIPSVSATIAKLVPADASEVSSKWVSYLWRTQTVSGTGSWPAPDGTSGLQGSSESSASGTVMGTLTNHHDGSYTYQFGNNISALTMGTGGEAIAYQRNLTHRVVVMMGGRSGATASPHFDFVPDGSGAVETRAIVETAACKQCHGQEFHGHGGNRITVESCATCHLPDAIDPHGGESLDLKVMIHKIHAGGELASVPGADGLVWDDPSTVADESADNGEYTIWGYNNTRFDWAKVGFPANIENCTKCHQGSGADVNAWKEKPSSAVCGSCHDDVDFTSGANHGGGPQPDSACALCHPASGDGLGGSITDAHDFTVKDPRNVPEFIATLTITNTPAAGYFSGSEAPIVELVLTDPATGAPINHNLAEDASAEGCWATVPADTTTPCEVSDGTFRASNLFVHGPRARQTPVLTTAARSQIFSATTGPFDLSATGASLILKLDQGQDIVTYDSSGGDVVRPGTVTVTVASAAVGTFADTAAATTDAVVTWLNANKAFAARAIAWNEAGKVGIRSRNLGRVFGLQLQASAVATSAFAGDLTIKMPSGSTPSNVVAARSNPALNDPKAVRSDGKITYYLDPVADLTPGTYVVDIEFADRGRVNPVPSTAPPTNYVAPTVARISFQVGTATEERPPAGNCDSCHEQGGKGFVVDDSRHNKHLDSTAPDRCASCHYQMPASVPSMTGYVPGGWNGARPISRRVHAIHFGSSLHYPLATVDYGNGDPVKGRNWDITLPQDVRNCQVCHDDSTSSGTWATNPGRLPCSGCHDSDGAAAHFKIMTFDPTPLDPYSGDEAESCKACH